jgi:hypothetical protein
MQSGILHRDTIVETRVNVLVFTYRLCLRSTSTAHGINNQINKTIEILLFFTNYGYNLYLNIKLAGP